MAVEAELAQVWRDPEDAGEQRAEGLGEGEVEVVIVVPVDEREDAQAVQRGPRRIVVVLKVLEAYVAAHAAQPHIRRRRAPAALVRRVGQSRAEDRGGPPLHASESALKAMAASVLGATSSP